MDKQILYFDGLCEPNPGGCMSWGWRIIDGGTESVADKGSQPPHPGNTNNVAEWYALGCALKYVAAQAEQPGELLICGDSQLVLRQLSGVWGCHKQHLQECLTKCRAMLEVIGAAWEARWIPRFQNADADLLSRQAYVAAMGVEPPERSWKR